MKEFKNQSALAGAGTFAYIRLGDLECMPNYAQRPLRESFVENAVAAFDDRLVSPLRVSGVLDNGKRHIIDGRHTQEILRRVYDLSEDDKVPCLVYDTTDMADIAWLFFHFNDGRRTVSALEKFKACVVSGEGDAAAINKLVNARGFKVHNASAARCITAVKALHKIYESSPTLLSSTLLALVEIWDEAKNMADGSILLGVASLLAVHPKIDRKRLAAKVSKEWPDPGGLVANAQQAAKITHTKPRDAVTGLIVNVYNKGLAEEKKL